MTLFAATMASSTTCAPVAAAKMCIRDRCGRGLKAQMKYADKIGAQYTIVLGENELAQGKAELKNMKTGEKKDISLGEDFIDQYITLSTQAADLAF